MVVAVPHASSTYKDGMMGCSLQLRNDTPSIYTMAEHLNQFAIDLGLYTSFSD